MHKYNFETEKKNLFIDAVWFLFENDDSQCTPTDGRVSERERQEVKKEKFHENKWTSAGQGDARREKQSIFQIM